MFAGCVVSYCSLNANTTKARWRVRTFVHRHYHSGVSSGTCFLKFKTNLCSLDSTTLQHHFCRSSLFVREESRRVHDSHCRTLHVTLTNPWWLGYINGSTVKASQSESWCRNKVLLLLFVALLLSQISLPTTCKPTRERNLLPSTIVWPWPFWPSYKTL